MQKRSRIPLLLSVTFGFGFTFSASAADEAPEPLSVIQLRDCAEQVVFLRKESNRLNSEADANDARRAEIAKLRTASKTTPALLISYSREAEDFNLEMVSFRRDVAALNGVKKAYDQKCAKRPYKRSDLETLPEAQANAMRKGLADVQVPHAVGAGVPE